MRAAIALVIFLCAYAHSNEHANKVISTSSKHHPFSVYCEDGDQKTLVENEIRKIDKISTYIRTALRKRLNQYYFLEIGISKNQQEYDLIVKSSTGDEQTNKKIILKIEKSDIFDKTPSTFKTTCTITYS